MGAKAIEISGGESYYCINEAQLKRAFELAHKNPESSGKIQEYLKKIEIELNRNERAALAFIIVDHLLKSN